MKPTQRQTARQKVQESPRRIPNVSDGGAWWVGYPLRFQEQLLSAPGCAQILSSLLYELHMLLRASWTRFFSTTSPRSAIPPDGFFERLASSTLVP